MKGLGAIVIVIWVSLFGPPAQADRFYGVETPSSDEVIQRALQSFSLYLHNIRETSAWKRFPDRLALNPDTVSECESEKFVLVSHHSNQNGVWRDGVTFFRCGRRIAEYAVERTGEDLSPLANEDLFLLKLPPASSSKTFRFRSSLYSTEIYSEKGASGRRGFIKFEFSGFPIRSDLAEVETTSADVRTSIRRYRLAALYGGHWRLISFEQRRIQAKSKAPTFRYSMQEDGTGAELSSGKYRVDLSIGFESQTIGLLNHLFQSPNSFPRVRTDGMHGMMLN